MSIRFREKFKKIKNAVLEFVYPTSVSCAACNKEIFEGGKYGLCGSCLSQMSVFDKKVSANGTDVFASYRYEGVVRNLVLNCKDGDEPCLAEVMAHFMADTVKKYGIKADIITYVPSMHKNKRRRGYDHTALIARFLSEELDIPKVKALTRTANGKDQTEIDFVKRMENVKDSFEYTGKGIEDKAVLIIDDVVTTGATLISCINTLKKGKPASVTPVTFAVGINLAETSV